jgi:Cys-tRNA(Pro)/Cys-tRNA(Cys) deacylase
MSEVKTNAMRMLDAARIPYNTYSYTVEDGHIDGGSVARKIGQPPELVYKTLLTQSHDRGVYVCVIPVANELDFKLCAKAFSQKSLELLPLSQITQVSGYVRGGCSPIGMKKRYPTLIEQSAQNLPVIIVSAGRIGLQMALCPSDLCKVTGAAFAALCR